MKKEIVYIILILILLLICFGVGYKRGQKSIEIQTDTIKIEKVIVEHSPISVDEQLLKVQKVKLPILAVFPEKPNKNIDSLKNIIDSLWKNKDSLEIELQRIQKCYKTDDYEAWVSGIDPTLDSIKFKQQIKQIVNTQVIESDKFYLNVGLNANNLPKKSYTINPNINVSYNWKQVTFTGEFGLDVPINNTSGTLPYFQLGINYTMWSF